MADWHLAASLVALRTEINRRWPDRDKASDGALGDASHAARKSDHNPDWDAGGVVRAIDVDKDGIDVQSLLNATIGDDRVWYVIWNRRIYSRTYGWESRPYDGSNPHDKHVHISIRHTSAAELDTSAWFNAVPPTNDQGDDDMPTIQEVEDAAYRADVRYGHALFGPKGTGTAVWKAIRANGTAIAALAAAIKAEDAADDAALRAAVSELQKSHDELDAAVQALADGADA